jgi:hypothetical protein
MTCEFMGRRPRVGDERKPVVWKTVRIIHTVAVGTSFPRPGAQRKTM